MVLRFRGIPLNQTPLSHVPQSGMIHIYSLQSLILLYTVHQDIWRWMNAFEYFILFYLKIFQVLDQVLDSHDFVAYSWNIVQFWSCRITTILYFKILPKTLLNSWNMTSRTWSPLLLSPSGCWSGVLVPGQHHLLHLLPLLRVWK